MLTSQANYIDSKMNRIQFIIPEARFLSLYVLYDRYDIRGNEWERMPDMHMGRADMGVACYRDKLFAIGGVTVNARGQVLNTRCLYI